MMERDVLNLETLLRVPYVEPDVGFDVSPDGGEIAFSWNSTGQWEIYVMPVKRSAFHGAQQVTKGLGAKIAPRWSPDARRLIYALDIDGGERYDLYVYDRSTGEHMNLTPDTPDAIQPACCWSPDGNWIAFIADRAGRFDTYVMPSGGGPARVVLSLPYPDWEVSWSPDGRRLAVVAETEGQDYGTFIVPLDGGEPRPIAIDGHPICAKNAGWSPDGERVAFSSNLEGCYNIGILELGTGQVSWVTPGEGEKESPAWSPDGRRLVFVVNHGPVSELNLLELDSGSTITYQVEPGVHYAPRFSPDGRQLLVVFDNPRHPCDIWRFNLGDGDLEQLTRSLPEGLTGAPFTMPTQIDYPSLDGVRVPALLYKPRHATELPAGIIYVHGGPNWLTQVTWDPLVQHMVSRGWVVLAPNYRGSTGYGRDWQLASRFDLGGCDTHDVVAGADYLAQEGVADRRRVAVTGTSWGGYLTMTSLTQYPDRWAAGSAVVPFLNWFTSHANSREDLQHWDRENFGDPEKDHELWYERSPYFFLDRVNAPVQLISGAQDVRCPASESIQAHDALVAQGKACDLVFYADEGHGFLKTENVVDAKMRRVTFLAEHLERRAGDGLPREA